MTMCKRLFIASIIAMTVIPTEIITKEINYEEIISFIFITLFAKFFT